MIENKYILDANYDFGKIAYVPIRFHKRTGFVKLTHSNVELQWPNNHELALIAEWFKRENIYRAFGFSRPPSLDNIKNSVLPDLTTRERRLEAVEFLIVYDHLNGKPIGFLVVYESRGRDDPNQEIDFAYIDESYLGKAATLRKIEHSIQSYLFAVRGARSVFWVRRKQVVTDANGNGVQGVEKNSFYQEKGKPVVTTRQRFKRRLERRKGERIEGAFPVVSLLKT